MVTSSLRVTGACVSFFTVLTSSPFKFLTRYSWGLHTNRAFQGAQPSLKELDEPRV